MPQPADHPTTAPLGECGQIGLGDSPRWDEHRQGVAASASRAGSPKRRFLKLQHNRPRRPQRDPRLWPDLICHGQPPAKP